MRKHVDAGQKPCSKEANEGRERIRKKITNKEIKGKEGKNEQNTKNRGQGHEKKQERDKRQSK